MDTNSKLDHEVAMCVDIRYRNSYHKECLINYLKHNGFSYIHPQNQITVIITRSEPATNM